MQLLYLGCDWFINTRFQPSTLINTAKKSNGELVFFGDVIQNAEGFFIWRLGILLNDEKSQTEFTETINKEMDITGWQPISEEHFRQGIQLEKWYRGMEVFEQTSWIDTMISYAIRNDLLKDRRDNETSECVYFAYEWLVLRHEVTQLSRLHSAISELRGAIYVLKLQKDQQGYHVYTLGIRAPSSSAMEHFMNEEAQSFSLRNGHPITIEDFYWGAKISEKGFNGLSVVEKIMSKYALENEQLNQKRRSEIKSDPPTKN